MENSEVTFEPELVKEVKRILGIQNIWKANVNINSPEGVFDDSKKAIDLLNSFKYTEQKIKKEVDDVVFITALDESLENDAPIYELSYYIANQIANKIAFDKLTRILQAEGEDMRHKANERFLKLPKRFVSFSLSKNVYDHSHE